MARIVCRNDAGMWNRVSVDRSRERMGCMTPKINIVNGSGHSAMVTDAPKLVLHDCAKDEIPGQSPVTPATLSVIMPVFNERHSLLSLLERIRAVPVEKEILIVDDGSTDGTRDILKNEV